MRPARVPPDLRGDLGYRIRHAARMRRLVRRQIASAAAAKRFGIKR